MVALSAFSLSSCEHAKRSEVGSSAEGEGEGEGEGQGEEEAPIDSVPVFKPSQSATGQFLEVPMPLPPRPALEVVERGRIAIDTARNESLVFVPGSVVVSADELEKTKPIIVDLNDQPAASLVIVGFASCPGSPEHARVLGEQRALVVREALIASGIHPARLHTLGAGADIVPVAGGRDQVRFSLLP